MPCSCINTPLGDFLRGAISDCVGIGRNVLDSPEPPHDDPVDLGDGTFYPTAESARRSLRPSLELLPEGSTCAKCGANVSLEDYCEACEEATR